MKQKLLSTAIVAALAGGIATQAGAVNLASDGVGDAMVFPYYTVNNGYDTNVNITNTSENSVVIKIRFREAYNSRDARDFNIVLSPYDVWTGTVTLSPDGEKARIVTGDKSCTAGQLLSLGDGRRYIDFTNFDYIDGNGIGPNDGGPTSLARTKEGYIEVFALGHQKPTNPGAASPDLTFPVDSVAHNAQHVDGVPRDCAAVRNAFTTANLVATTAAHLEPINVIKGTASLLKSDQGKAATYEATVFSNFYNPAIVDDAGALGENLITAPDSNLPGFNDVLPPVADIIDNTVGTAVTDLFTYPVNAVSAVIARQSVANQYSVNPANNGQTDWIVTFPTKYFYVDEREAAVGASTPVAPFAGAGTIFETFQDINTPACSPVKVSYRFFDREENEATQESTVGFSPAPPGVPEESICYEANVITFNSSNVFGSPLSSNVDVEAEAFRSGWMNMVFPEAGDIVGDGGVIFTGLPVVGFSMTTLENGTTADSVLNYGLSFPHSYTRTIATP